MQSKSTTPAEAVREELIDGVLGASRALVAVAARSLAVVAEDVSLAQYRFLVVLASRGPERLADLATALGVDRSTATRMCDRLVHKRLVTRGVFAAAAQAPLTAISSVIEMTGNYGITIPIMLTCGIASAISKQISYGSVYTTKLLRRGIDIERPKTTSVLQTLTA